MFNLDTTPGRTAMVNGKEYLFFSGYSYLGMNHVSQFVGLVKEGIDKYGLLHPSSRISNTTLDLFEAFETKLAEITSSETAVCFTSGFLAGRAVMEVLKHETIFCAPAAHPAICDERNTDQTFGQWTEAVLSEIDKATGTPVLAFDSVNPLTAEVNDVSFLEKIEKKIICIIDDSHGAGLIRNGKGISARLPKKENIEYVITYSLSKAFNLVGGAVSCSDRFAKQLRSCSYYTASTSIAPAFAYAFVNGQHLYQQQRELLKRNIQLATRLTKYVPAPGNHELPVFILPGDVDENKLETEGIIISSFAYPDPKGKKIKRVVLSALHTEADLRKLADQLFK